MDFRVVFAVCKRNLVFPFEFWNVWIIYESHIEALEAYKESTSKQLKCCLINEATKGIECDVYYPPAFRECETKGSY